MKRRTFLLLMPFLFLACFFINPNSLQAQTNQWTSASSTMPTARTGMSSVVIGQKIYVLGGRQYMNALSYENKNEVYDTANDAWEIKTPPPIARWGATAATVDGKLFLVAAGSPIPQGSPKLEEYNPESDSWSQKAEMPQPGWGAVSAVADGKIYVVGGYNWANKGMNYNREYDPKTNVWTLKAPMPTRRSWFGAEAINGKIYAVGGWNWNDTADLATLEIYDPKTNIWQTKAPMPKGLRGIATAVLDNKLYVIGGEQGEGNALVLHDSVLVYDPATNLWQELSLKLPKPISVAEAQTVDGVIYLIGGYTYGQELNSVYYWPEKTKKIEPVILVPGIMGSWKVSGQWELDPILHTYDNLWQALKNAGYEEGKTLFALPYQWRLSNGYTAELLKQKIQEVKDISGSSKVDIIAHSMGGLIARSYIEGNNYQDNIDQLIFLATPHRGSTKAYLMWEGGEFGQTATDFVFERILTIEADFNGYGSLFSYIKNLPMQSVQELLPTYDYLRDKNTMTLRTYPNNYPINAFLELLNNPLELQKLNSVRMMNVLADAGASSTIENLRVVNKEFAGGEWPNGYPDNYSLPFTDHGLEYGSGDETVPGKSNKDFASLENVIINSNHSNITTDAQKRVIKELTGVEPTQEVRLNIFKKFFLVRIFSPADFVITAPDGKKLGKDFVSSQTVNEIAGAFYSGFDADAEFAVIPDPTDGEYKIELQGTGQGEYKLSVSLIDDNQQVDQEFSGSIISGQPRDFNITYSAASENQLSDLAPIDIVPPVVVINQPIENDQYLHSDNLLIDYTATDDFSGVATTTISIDDQIIATTTIDLFDYSLGTHNLIVSALDKSGNRAEAQVNFEIITNIDSTISDIEKIYERGWLTDKIYEKLLEDAFKLLKLEAKYFNREQKLTEKLREKMQDNNKLTDKKKQKLIEQYNKKLAELKKNRQKAINRSLDSIIRLLKKAKDKGLLNQQGYDIILSDVDYLRNNL